MIHHFRQEYKSHLIDIDIKSHKFPWLPPAWNDIQGYVFRVLMTDVPRGYLAFKVKDKRTLMVVKLCVHPSWWGKGFGSELHKELLRCSRANNYQQLQMVIHEENEVGIDFLSKRGWRAIKIEKGIFPDGSDGYLFGRENIAL